MKALIESIKINNGILRMMKVAGSVCFLVHLMACFWYLLAKLENFGPDTWVVRSGLIDDDYLTKYLSSVYWAFQTLTTVGYGDISAHTNLEICLSLAWMIFGVGFYSFTIGNLSSII